MGPFDNDNCGVIYVGDPDTLPNIWADSTVLLPDDNNQDNENQ